MHGMYGRLNIQTLGEYHDLHVKTDVLLLADIFLTFRSLCLQYYEIEPTHVFSTPGLAWYGCLKMCNTSLELLTDIDMFLTIEHGVRGGVSLISRRWARANHPQLEDFHSIKPISHIVHWDANNLYAHSQIQPLPCADFQ